MARFCHQCAAPVEPSMKACPNCGTWISPPAATTSVQASATIPAGSYAAEIFSSKPEEAVYPPAPLLQRAVAWLLDAILVAVPGYLGVTGIVVGVSAVGANTDWSAPVMIAGVGVIVWSAWYYFAKDGGRRGAGLGKRAMGLMVIHLPTKKPCTRSQSATRSLIWLVLGIVPILGWLVEPVVALVSNGGRRLGDRLADTQVIEATLLKKGRGTP